MAPKTSNTNDSRPRGYNRRIERLVSLFLLALSAAATASSATTTASVNTRGISERHDLTTSSSNNKKNNNSRKKKRPNILLLLADDLGYGEVEGYNPTTPIKTPRLERLQSEGMKFTDFYAGEAVCAPSRCALFTGKHTGHSTVRGNRKGPDGFDFPLEADPGDVTIAQLLRDEAGYR